MASIRETISVQTQDRAELEPVARHTQLVARHSNQVWVSLAATVTCISARVEERFGSCGLSSEAIDDAVIQLTFGVA